MNRAPAFLAAIREDPDDDVARLVFADWLLDHGDPQGDFIHAQVRLAALPDSHPARLELAERAADLLHEHGARWAGPAAEIAQNWQFRRGLLEQVTLSESAFLEHAEELTRIFPVRAVRLLVEGSGKLEELAACPHLEGIEEVDLQSAQTSFGQWAFDERSFGIFLLSSYLDRLKALRVTGNAIAYTHLQTLVDAPLFGRLMRLDLTGNTCLAGHTAGILKTASASALEELVLSRTRLGIFGLLHVLNSEHLPKLRRLEVAEADLTESAAGSVGKALVASPILPHLHTLNLNGWGRDPIRNWPDIFRSSQVSQLRVLRLNGHQLGDAGARALAESPYLQHLTALDQSSNQLTHEAGHALAASPHLARLTELNLANNNLRDRGTRALAASPHLQNLSSLDLTGNVIGGPGLRALADAPSLANLTTLRLGSNFVGMEILAALADSPHLAHLTHLDLSGNNLPTEAARLLAASSHLARLTHLDLSANALGDGGLRGLAASPWLTRLVELVVGGNNIGQEGSAAMLALFAGSPVLRGLRRLGLKGNCFTELERARLGKPFDLG